jgi:hypothetical protein
MILFIIKNFTREGLKLKIVQIFLYTNEKIIKKNNLNLALINNHT